MPQKVRASPNPPDNQTQRPPSNQRLTHTTPRTRARRGEEEEETEGRVFTHKHLSTVQATQSSQVQNMSETSAYESMHVQLHKPTDNYQRKGS